MITTTNQIPTRLKRAKGLRISLTTERLATEATRVIDHEGSRVEVMDGIAEIVIVTPAEANDTSSRVGVIHLEEQVKKIVAIAAAAGEIAAAAGEIVMVVAIDQNAQEMKARSKGLKGVDKGRVEALAAEIDPKIRAAALRGEIKKNTVNGETIEQVQVEQETAKDRDQNPTYP